MKLLDLPQESYILENITSIQSKGGTIATSKKYSSLTSYVTQQHASQASIQKDSEFSLFKIVLAKAPLIDIERILQADSKCITEPDRNGKTVMHIAAERNDIALLDLLYSYSGKIEAVSKYGITPLISAAITNSVKALNWLIEKGANINASTNDQRTVLYHSVTMNSQECCKALIHAGVDVNKCSAIGNSALFTAISKNYMNILKYLLQSNCRVNSKQCNVLGELKTPLEYAACSGKANIVSILLDYGCQRHVVTAALKAVLANEISSEKVKLCLQMLQKHNKTTSSLQHICRTVVRESVRQPVLQNIDSLPLPQLLLGFMKFKELCL